MVDKQKNLAKLLLVVMNYMPLMIVISHACLFYALLSETSFLTSLAITAASFYLSPIAMCRVGFTLFGKPRPNHALYSKDFFLWWFSLQCQSLFIRFTFFEELLRIVPGLYSQWLRLWGAKIGKFTFWSGGVHILDRPFLEVGDHVVFGYGVGVSAHLWNQENGQSQFIFAPVKVGSQVLIGAKANLTPGVVVESGRKVPAMKFLTQRKSQVL